MRQEFSLDYTKIINENLFGKLFSLRYGYPINKVKVEFNKPEDYDWLTNKINRNSKLGRDFFLDFFKKKDNFPKDWVETDEGLFLPRDYLKTNPFYRKFISKIEKYLEREIIKVQYQDFLKPEETIHFGVLFPLTVDYFSKTKTGKVKLDLQTESLSWA